MLFSVFLPVWFFTYLEIHIEREIMTTKDDVIRLSIFWIHNLWILSGYSHCEFSYESSWNRPPQRHLCIHDCSTDVSVCRQFFIPTEVSSYHCIFEKATRRKTSIVGCKHVFATASWVAISKGYCKFSEWWRVQYALVPADTYLSCSVWSIYNSLTYTFLTDY